MSNRKVNTETTFNILSTLIRTGVYFLTMPLFTRLLGAEQYGLFSVFSSWLILITCFISLGTGQGISTGRYIFAEHYEEFRSSTLLLGTVISAAFILLGFLFRRPLSAYMGYSSGVFMLLFVLAFAHYVVEFAQGAFVYEKRAKYNFAVSIGLLITTVGLSLLLIRFGGFQELFLSRVYGSFFPYASAAVVLWLAFYLKKPTGFNKAYWKYSLMLGFPLVFHSLSQNLLSHSDRLMLQYLGYAGASVGIYSTFHTYTGITSSLLNALNTSWCPFYYDDLNERAFDRLKGKCRNYLELYTVLACGFILLSREVSFIFADQEYAAGLNLIPIFVCAIYFQFMYQFPVNFEFYNRKTTIIAIGTCVAGLVNIAINALLIPPYGMYGAAIATAASYGMLFVAHFFIVKHLRCMEFHMKLWQFLPGLAAVIATSALFYVLADMWLIRWVLGAAIGAIECWRILKRKTVF